MEARIVVIDNDDAMRGLLTASLEKEGWQVSSYDYANINLIALIKKAPNLIILDFNPRDEIIGWEFLQFLKMEDATAHIPMLITTTAFELPAELEDYLFTHYIQVIHKPYDLNVFSALVQKTLKQASQAGEIFSGDRTLPILLVEDTEEIRETLTTVLRFEGYRVVTAYNGLVALDTVSRADYCLILLDVNMPVMDGYEFLNAYEQQVRPHAPVIILSAEHDLQSRVLPTFVVDILQKPFDFHQLLSRVSKFSQPV